MRYFKLDENDQFVETAEETTFIAEPLTQADLQEMGFDKGGSVNGHTKCTCNKGQGKCKSTNSNRCRENNDSIGECFRQLYEACRG